MKNYYAESISIVRRSRAAGPSPFPPAWRRLPTCLHRWTTPGYVKIAFGALILSTGRLFQAYLSAFGKSRLQHWASISGFWTAPGLQPWQADMVDSAIALGVDGIIIQHGSDRIHRRKRHPAAPSMQASRSFLRC